MKIGLKQLFDMQDNLDWDDEIPTNMTNWWVEVLTEAIKAEILKFPRKTEPVNALGFVMEHCLRMLPISILDGKWQNLISKASCFQ